MLPAIRKWHTPTVYTSKVRDELFSNVSNIFDDFFSNDFFDLVKSQGVTLSQGSYPRVDITDYDDRIEIESEIPGLKKEDLDVEFCDGVLTIKGNKHQNEEKKEDGKVVFKELKRSSFQRSFALDNTLDTNTVDAKFDNGILNIIIKKFIPTKLKTEIKKIEIK